MPVGEMLQRMTSSELTEWLAYFDLQVNPQKKSQGVSEAKAVLEMMRHLPASKTSRRTRRG